MFPNMPRTSFNGARTKRDAYEPPNVTNTDGISTMPIKEPPDVKTPMRIQAAPPIIPINVAISIYVTSSFIIPVYIYRFADGRQSLCQ